jgi:hypothetical protein
LNKSLTPALSKGEGAEISLSLKALSFGEGAEISLSLKVLSFGEDLGEAEAYVSKLIH